MAAIAAGTLAIMPGHLLVPAVDDVSATVSSIWLTDILRRQLGFTGTVVTDAPALASYGATLAPTRAVVELLDGVAVTA